METIDLLASSKTKSEINSSSTVSSETKKEGLSLFDSLLSEASSQDIVKSGSEEKQVTNKSNETIEKSSTSSNITSEEKTEIKVETKTETSNEESEVNPSSKKETSSLSLLDRMLLEVKQSISNEETLNKETTSSPSKNILSNSEILNNIKNRKETKETPLSNDSKNPSIPVNSEKTEDTLLNTSEVENTKTDTKLNNKVENNVENKTQNNSDSKIENKVEDNVENKTQNNSDNKIENKVENSVENKTQNNSDNKIENKTENKVEDKKIQKPVLDTSVLDNSEINNEIILQVSDSKTLETDTLETIENSKDTQKNSDNAMGAKEIKNEKVVVENISVDTTTSLDIQTSNKTEEVVKQNPQDNVQASKAILEATNSEKSLNEEVVVSKPITNNIFVAKDDTVSNDVVSKEVLTNNEKPTLEKELSTKIVDETAKNKPEELNQKVDIKEAKENSTLEVIEKKVENKQLDINIAEDKKTINNESSKNITTSLQNQTNENLATTKNEKVANEFAKLDNTTASENKKVQVDTSELKNSEPSLENEKPTNKKTLIEKLVDEENSLKKEEIVQSKVETKTDEKATLNGKNDLLTNIYLSSQKNSIVNQSIIAQYEGVKVAKEANNIEDIKKSAKILELELTDAKVEIKDNINKEVSKNTILEKIVINRNLVQELTNSTLPTQVTSSLPQANSTSVPHNSNTTINEMPDVALNVPQNIAMSIQSKIIGARQQMSSMMSDIARTMYENYKPPVTAFRINLFPAQLGTIAILMKNDRDSGGLNISLNISNSSTLEAFIDNETGLKSALLKTFESESEFNLDFNSDDASQNSSSNNQQEQQASTRRESFSSNEILNSLNSNKNDKANISNYM